MTRYSVEPITRKYIKGYRFLSFERNLYEKYARKLLDTATRTELNPAKAASEKVSHKTVEATGE